MSLSVKTELITKEEIKTLLTKKIILPYLKEGFDQSDLIKFFLFIAIKHSISEYWKPVKSDPTPSEINQDASTPLSIKYWENLKLIESHAPLFNKYSCSVLRSSYDRVFKKQTADELINKFLKNYATPNGSDQEAFDDNSFSDVKLEDSMKLKFESKSPPNSASLVNFFSKKMFNTQEGQSLQSELSNLIDDTITISTHYPDDMYDNLIKTYSKKEIELSSNETIKKYKSASNFTILNLKEDSNEISTSALNIHRSQKDPENPTEVPYLACKRYLP